MFVSKFENICGVKDSKSNNFIALVLLVGNQNSNDHVLRWT